MQEVCNKSDFIITLSLVDKDSVVIPYNEIDWEVWYYTHIQFPYKVTHRNGVLSPNAEIDGNNIIIRVNAFDFVIKGNVYRKGFASFVDAKFPDGKADVCSIAEQVTTFKIV